MSTTSTRTRTRTSANDSPPTGTPTEPEDGALVWLHNGVVRLHEFECADTAVAEVLTRLPSQDRAAALRRMLGIGARAMVGTAVGVDLDAIDERVLRAIDGATATAEARVRAIVADAESAMRASLDPNTRTSAMARAISEMQEVRSSIVDSVDPRRTDSHVGSLLLSITSMLGPGGELEARLAAAFDPTSDESGLASFRRDVTRQFSDLRELLAEHRGRRDEADAGTRKGFAFEDLIEDRLRSVARPIGALVDRTSTCTGEVGDSLVGDFVVTLAGGTTIVVEAKNTGRIGLNGAGGILAELDRAMANRGAAFSICVSAREAFPTEVGSFGVYGNRILVVDEGDGTMLEVAIRWITLLTAVAGGSSDAVDVDALASLADRIRRLAPLLSNHRRALTDSMDSIERVRSGLDEMRRELLTQLDEMDFELQRGVNGTSLRAVG